MLDIKDFLKEKTNLPDFLKNHKAFKEISNVTKVFPSLGLKNFTVDTELKNADIRSFASSLIYKITYAFSNAEYFTLRQSNRAEQAPLSALLRSVYSAINTTHSRMVEEIDKTSKLTLLQDIQGMDGKIWLPAGTSLFKVYNKGMELMKDTGCKEFVPLETLQQFKDFSANNVSGKMQIAFAADGMEGAWDIATMSSRGIRSCQSWDGQYKECLVGSITDPYTGIIYTTTGTKQTYGTKMVRRSIVRFVVNKETNEQCIFLDKMYPQYDIATMTAFKKEIASRISPSIKIIDVHTHPYGKFKDFFIPSNPFTGILLKSRRDNGKVDYNLSGYHNQHLILSYRDTLIEFRNKPSLTEALENARQIKSKAFKNACYGFLAEKTNLSYEYSSLIEKLVSKAIFDSIILDESMVPSMIVRRSCLIYFKSPKSILDKVLIDIAAYQKKVKKKTYLLEGIKHLVVDEPKNKIKLEDFIRSDFNAFVSSYMLDLWNSSIKKSALVKRKSTKKATK